MENNALEKQDRILNADEVYKRFGFTETLAKRYLPKPADWHIAKSGVRVPCWREADVLKALERDEVRQRAEKRLRLRERRIERRKEEKKPRKRKRKKKKPSPQELERRAFLAFLSQFRLERMMIDAAYLRRRFVLHVGPTNSGKTYDAIRALMKARSGTYLGPLRLLALELFDKLNETGCRCSLLTGEEQELVEGAEHVASTIELCDYRRHYDVAVIDEAQMLADPFRGAHWTRALLGVNADEVHVCFAPEALDIVTWLLKGIGAEYELVTHERLCPLEYRGKLGGLKNVQPGDALITFSRKGVLGLSAELERRGYKTSVIYGALPPESRREEVRKFASGATQVVVATDAIGMGVSLPIRRVVFCETQKYDGASRRELNAVEVKQIAGRAGRFGIYDVGEVLTLTDDAVVRLGMAAPSPPIETVATPFPREALDSPHPLERLLKAWQKLPVQNRERRVDLSDALILLKHLPESAADVPKTLVYDLITCPVDTSTPELIYYWQSCVKRIAKEAPVPFPRFDRSSLEGCELQYRAYDIRGQLLRRIGLEDDSAERKRDLSARINAFLAQDKRTLERKCLKCGKPLPFDWPYRVCGACRYRGPR